MSNKVISQTKAQAMNRKDRRILGKLNGGLKIPGSNVPIINLEKKARRESRASL